MFTTPGPLDFVAIAGATREFWDREQVFARLVAQNRGGPRFSFLDGPITANNPMGIHHAWGRTSKDVIQRYKAMCGYEQRFQNGFDCQGLWVEVEVEKALGFDSKREIESFGLERFSRACRERVLHFSGVQTEQSRKLGQWMDWPNSYFTMSDTNIEYNWHFLKRCHERGWLYAGRRAMPWCARCGTSISQHEMLDAYAEVTHESVTAAFSLADRPGHRLLVWTTTPWTLPANVAVAVHPSLDYAECESAEGVYYVAAPLAGRYPGLGKPRRTVKGIDLVGLRYRGPFDDLPAQRGVEHRVIPWDEVSAEEGTGLVHIAPGCGQEDFELGRRHNLPAVAAVAEDGRYLDGFGPLAGASALDSAAAIVRLLKERGALFARAPYRHRYPTCWRCGQELIFRLAEEWFIGAAEIRPVARAANQRVTWLPAYIGRRMDDWLANMGDWCISRKRYWGLPLPFYRCQCAHLTVVGSREELRALAVDPKAVDAVPELHRPWIDNVLVRCPGCARPVRRILEVGDCWLDAGIVPFSTLGYREDRRQWEQWFPADFVVEGVGQVRGWFYALLFMSTALTGTSPYRTVMAHERVLAADGREMHKSWGNAVWFDDAVDEMGPDVIRSLFASQPISEPIRFGVEAAREVKRRLLTFWNIYGLFVTHASLDRPSLQSPDVLPVGAAPLEQWLLSRLQGVIAEVREALDAYQIRRAVTAVDAFIHDGLSNWYVRRRRRELWKGTLDDEKRAAYQTLYHVLVRVCQLLAPVMPFLVEHVYRNLVADVSGGAPISIHLTRFPEPDGALAQPALEAAVQAARRALSVGLAARNAAKLKVRQPLGRAFLMAPPDVERGIRAFERDILDELNVERLETAASLDDTLTVTVELDVRDTSRLPRNAVPALRAALAMRAGKAVRDALLAAGHVTLPVGDSEISLGWADLRVTVQGRDGFAAAADRDVVVVLDTTITPALRRKAVARHLVHQVQMMRKEARLNVEDRIRVAVDDAGEAAEAIDEHRAYICAETLAVELYLGPLPDGWMAREADLEEARITVALTRA
ncbi:MAG TPA: isoleucine--tRNA ligase [Methylomirabilota bacterium]|nr:isoleucine--tRNA ligase [Methylomirabilota bacterium]